MTWLHLVGGGVASLHLAHRLSRTAVLPGKLVISEPDPEPLSNKTLCGFWPTDRVLPIQPSQRWREWRFSAGQRAVCHRADRWSYCRYSGQQFAQAVRVELLSHPQIEWRQEKLDAPPDAEWVFDSRPPRLEEFQAFQSFVGVEVDARPGDTLGLMENIHSADDGITFLYRLPLGDRTLVELTRFETRPTPLGDLESQLRSLTGDGPVHYREAAVIPMGVRCREHWGIPIGARGGFARASTGYSFFASQRWAEGAAKALLKGRRPVGPSGSLEQWMDRVFLRMLRTHPERLAAALYAIAERMAADDFAAFMAGGSIPACFKMIMRAPAAPFLRAAMSSA